MSSDITGGPGTKWVTVGFKEIPISQESLTAEELLEKAGLDPLEYELRFPSSTRPISSSTEITVEDGMKIDAVIKSR
jgi:hypothetical protein